MLLSSNKNKPKMISRCSNLRMVTLMLTNQAIKLVMGEVDVSQRPREMKSGNEDNRLGMGKMKKMLFKRCLKQALL